MKSVIRFLMVFVLILACTSAQGQNEVETFEVLKQKSLHFIELLKDGKFEESTAGFDSTMASALPANKVSEIWAALNAQMGDYVGTGDTRFGQGGGYNIAFVTMDFDRGSLEAKIVYDAENRIAGLFFQPVEEEITFPTPPYADTDLFIEMGVTFGRPGWELPGTLSLPKGEGTFPGVVLVYGSGPLDRDATVGVNKPFRDIAWGLASQGIAVWRFDKSTFIHGDRFADEGNYTVDDETILDAREALSFLAGIEQVDPGRVFYLGHSLGATVAAEVLLAGPEVAGAILLAPTARPLEDVIVEQLRFLESAGKLPPSFDIQQMERQVEYVKSDRLTPESPVDSLPLGTSGTYWLSIRNWDPVSKTAQLTVPVLLLHGKRDYQVTQTDFDLWGKGLTPLKDATLKQYTSLNHLFIPGEGDPTPEEMTQTQGHVLPQVINDIVEWIGSH